MNYLVLALGILLLDDNFVFPGWPGFMKRSSLATKEAKPLATAPLEEKWWKKLGVQLSALKLAVTAVMLTWIFYATLAEMGCTGKQWPRSSILVSALEPFRLANSYCLFSLMTRRPSEIT